MNLCDYNTIRDLLTRHGFHFSKSMGQNFLIDPEVPRRIAEASGADGMVAGQVLDTLHAPRSEAEVTEVHRLKTGAMIAGACRLGVAAAGGGEDLMSAAGTYARELGLAFQIRDDMLDVIGDAQTLGKAVGVDECKNTFVRLYGMEACQALVTEHTELAVAALTPFADAAWLQELAESLTDRRF